MNININDTQPGELTVEVTGRANRLVVSVKIEATPLGAIVTITEPPRPSQRLLVQPIDKSQPPG